MKYVDSSLKLRPGQGILQVARKEGHIFGKDAFLPCNLKNSDMSFPGEGFEDGQIQILHATAGRLPLVWKWRGPIQAAFQRPWFGHGHGSLSCEAAEPKLFATDGSIHTLQQFRKNKLLDLDLAVLLILVHQIHQVMTIFEHCSICSALMTHNPLMLLELEYESKVYLKKCFLSHVHFFAAAFWFWPPPRNHCQGSWLRSRGIATTSNRWHRLAQRDHVPFGDKISNSYAIPSQNHGWPLATRLENGLDILGQTPAVYPAPVRSFGWTLKKPWSTLEATTIGGDGG